MSALLSPARRERILDRVDALRDSIRPSQVTIDAAARAVTADVSWLCDTLGDADDTIRETEHIADMLAETARRLTAERDALNAFARKVIESSSFRGCDADGGDVQDWAVGAGILMPVAMTEPCTKDGEGCQCAEFGFPTTCYRFARAAARPEGA